MRKADQSKRDRKGERRAYYVREFNSTTCLPARNSLGELLSLPAIAAFLYASKSERQPERTTARGTPTPPAPGALEWDRSGCPEDVVQETFFEAWRHLEKLREPERLAAWLDGICRNVCKRQARLQANGAHEVPFAGNEDEVSTADVDTYDPLSIDPEEELERQSRRILLYRAIGYLSESARELIELCYLAELPQREVAHKLDMSLGALELKLHRVRRQLRQVLNGELREDAREFGLLLNEDESMGWQETREWCVMCGRQRLRGKFERQLSGIVGLRLRCPACSKQYGIDIIHTGDIVQLDGLRSFRTAMKRSLQSAAAYFTMALNERRCIVCQATIQLQIFQHDD